MMVRSYILSVIVMLTLFAGQVWAGEYTFYVGEIYPFTVVSGSKVTGAAVDIVSELMGALEKPVEQTDIHSINWARSLEIVETTPNTGLFLVARTPQRENNFKWVGPVAELKLGLVARKDSRITIETAEDLQQYSIGVVRNSAPADLLKSEYGLSEDHLVFLKGDTLQFRMLEARRVDLITQADTAAPNWLKKLGMDQSEYEMVHVMKRLQLYLVFNRQTDDKFIDGLQNALARMKLKDSDGMSQHDRILGNYFADGRLTIKQ